MAPKAMQFLRIFYFEKIFLSGALVVGDRHTGPPKYGPVGVCFDFEIVFSS